MLLESTIKWNVEIGNHCFLVAMVTTLKKDLHEITSILGISFTVSNIETQGRWQIDAFRKQY